MVKDIYIYTYIRTEEAKVRRLRKDKNECLNRVLDNE